LEQFSRSLRTGSSSRIFVLDLRSRRMTPLIWRERVGKSANPSLLCFAV